MQALERESKVGVPIVVPALALVVSTSTSHDLAVCEADEIELLAAGALRDGGFRDLANLKQFRVLPSLVP